MKLKRILMNKLQYRTVYNIANLIGSLFVGFGLSVNNCEKRVGRRDIGTQ